MDVRQVVRGTYTGFSQPRAVRSGTDQTAGVSADRLELSRQWVEEMQEQSRRIQSLWSQPADQEKKSNGILDMLDAPTEESQEMDELSKELDVQMKCMKIAANIMKGKKVPPEDERYLMENDPNAYKLAIAMRSLVKEDDEECESVLKDEDKEQATGEASGTEASAPAESGGEAVSSGQTE